MKAEFSLMNMVTDRRFLFIYPVYSFGFSQALSAVIIQEYLFLKNAGHVHDRFLLIQPVIYVSFRNEDLSFCRSYKKIGFDVAHH